MTTDTAVAPAALNARRAEWMRRGTLLAILSLLATIAWQTLVSPSGNRQPNVVVWLALSLPLVILLPGLWKGGLRSHSWSSFVSLLYFAVAVTGFAAGARTAVVLELVASVALFVCTLLFVRWRARADRAAAAADSASV